MPEPFASLLPGLDPHRAMTTLAAMSGFLAVVVVCWPYLKPDLLGARIRALDAERERIRTRERAKLDAGQRSLSLRSEPRRLYRLIVDRFDLTKQAEDGAVAAKLRMAGLRGQAPLITYLAAQVLAPVIVGLISALYAFVILRDALAMPVQMVLPVAAAAVGSQAPRLYIANRIAKRQTSIRRAWPDALDLLLICVESGMSIEGAFRRVAQEIVEQSRELSEELALLTAELAYLQDRRSAYEHLGQRTGLDTVRNTMTSLIQAEKYGTPVGQALRVLAQESRDTRMAEAEKKAAALPPKLTVPMIVFFLPVLFAVILTPAAIQIWAE